MEPSLKSGNLTMLECSIGTQDMSSCLAVSTGLSFIQDGAAGMQAKLLTPPRKPDETCIEWKISTSDIIEQ